jgi:hypothetical protein
LLDKPGYTAAGTLMPSKLRSMHLGFWEYATGALAAEMGHVALGGIGNRPVVSLIAFLLKLGSKSHATSTTTEV